LAAIKTRRSSDTASGVVTVPIGEEQTHKYRSLKNIVNDFILRALREGRLRPGDRILQREICDALGVSPTPVREALLQLEPLGLVSFLPRKRVVVNGLSLQDVAELFDTIAPLEAAAARLATPHLTDEDFISFERSIGVMQVLIAKRDLLSLNREMETFHHIHLRRCPNALMVATIRQLKRRFYDPPQRLEFISEWEAQLLTEHRRLVDLFRAKDAEAVAQFMLMHWSWEHNRSQAVRSYFPALSLVQERGR
jgi:DNA-binding GntR family transcriptional regulator